MSFTVSIADDRLGIIASDTRYSYADGVRDEGGKLRRIPGGWVTVTGRGPFTAMGQRVLERAGASEEAALSALTECYSRHTWPDDAAWPMEEQWGASFLVLREEATGCRTYSIRRASPEDPRLCVQHTPHPQGMLLSFPGGMHERLKGAAGDRLEQLLGRADGSVPSLIRAVAQLFAEVHLNLGEDGSVSPDLEIGISARSDPLASVTRPLPRAGRLQNGYLTGRAAELMGLSDRQLMVRVVPPPAPPAFPTSAEQRNMDLARRLTQEGASS